MFITTFGQSTLLVEDGESRLLIDPGTLTSDEAFALTGLSAVLLTHDHPDHCAPDGVRELLAHNTMAMVFGAPAIGAALPFLGDAGFRVLLDDEDLASGNLRMQVHRGEHALIHRALPRADNIGVVVTDRAGTRLFHPGDSYEWVPEDVDVLALPIVGPWGSLREAVDFADAVAPRRMFPIHDAHLSESGRALFWPWIQSLSDDRIVGFDPSRGVTVDPTADA